MPLLCVPEIFVSTSSKSLVFWNDSLKYSSQIWNDVAHLDSLQSDRQMGPVHRMLKSHVSGSGKNRIVS